MKKNLKIAFLACMAVLVAWSFLAPARVAVADTADQKRQLEAQLTAMVKQEDEHVLAVAVQTRWPVLGSPTPAADFYDLQYGLNRVAIARSLSINAYVLDYATPGSPTVVVPTMMPTRTPAPTPTP